MAVLPNTELLPFDVGIVQGQENRNEASEAFFDSPTAPSMHETNIPLPTDFMSSDMHDLLVNYQISHIEKKESPTSEEEKTRVRANGMSKANKKRMSVPMPVSNLTSPSVSKQQRASMSMSARSANTASHFVFHTITPRSPPSNLIRLDTDDTGELSVECFNFFTPTLRLVESPKGLFQHAKNMQHMLRKKEKRKREKDEKKRNFSDSLYNYSYTKPTFQPLQPSAYDSAPEDGVGRTRGDSMVSASGHNTPFSPSELDIDYFGRHQKEKQLLEDQGARHMESTVRYHELNRSVSVQPTNVPQTRRGKQFKKKWPKPNRSSASMSRSTRTTRSTASQSPQKKKHRMRIRSTNMPITKSQSMMNARQNGPLAESNEEGDSSTPGSSSSSLVSPILTMSVTSPVGKSLTSPFFVEASPRIEELMDRFAPKPKNSQKKKKKKQKGYSRAMSTRHVSRPRMRKNANAQNSSPSKPVRAESARKGRSFFATIKKSISTNRTKSVGSVGKIRNTSARIAVIASQDPSELPSPSKSKSVSNSGNSGSPGTQATVVVHEGLDENKTGNVTPTQSPTAKAIPCLLLVSGISPTYRNSPSYDTGDEMLEYELPKLEPEKRSNTDN